MTRVAPTTVYSEHARRAQRAQLAYLQRQGRYAMGSGDYIDFGNRTDFDGVAAAWWAVCFEYRGTPNKALAGRPASVAAEQQWYTRINGSAQLYARVATDLAGNGGGVVGSTTLQADGTLYWYLVLYDGSGAGNADRLRLLLRTKPPGGRWSAWADDAGSYVGAAIPATLVTPTLSANLRLGRFDNGDDPESIFEDFRWGTTLPTREQRSVMSLDAAPEADHWYPLRIDADDAVGAYDGTVTGAELQTRYAVVTDAALEDAAFATAAGDGRLYIKDSAVSGSILAYTGEARRLSIISAPTA